LDLEKSIHNDIFGI